MVQYRSFAWPGFLQEWMACVVRMAEDSNGRGGEGRKWGLCGWMAHEETLTKRYAAGEKKGSRRVIRVPPGDFCFFCFSTFVFLSWCGWGGDNAVRMQSERCVPLYLYGGSVMMGRRSLTECRNMRRSRLADHAHEEK